MNIASTQYSLGQQSYEIYVSGCDGACPGCHNKELQDYKLGTDFRTWYEKIEISLGSFPELIRQIWVLGGEPLLQTRKDLIDLLDFLMLFKKPIFLFTRFDAEDVPDWVIPRVDFIKTGSYREKERTDGLIQYGIALASVNQRIWTREEILEYRKETHR